MKKTLLVYYSFEGNTQFAAETAAKAAEMDVQRLETDKEPPKEGAGKYIWGGKSVVFGEKPKLHPQTYSASDYENIILGFPVWAGSYAPPIATYLKENDFSGKKIYAIVCSGGGGTEKAIKKLGSKMNGGELVDTLSLIDPLKDKDTNEKLVTDFIRKNFAE